MAYCLLSNHWHLVLWPERDGDLGAFMQKLTITHARNWQVYRRRVGYGHLYQGRYKSFPVESDEHFYQVVRYVERNALRAKMVRRADDWRYSSLWRRLHGPVESRGMLSDWPLPLPRSWLQYVNQPQSEAELNAIRLSVQRGQPYGGDAWARDTAAATLGPAPSPPVSGWNRASTVVASRNKDVHPLRVARFIAPLPRRAMPNGYQNEAEPCR